MDCDGRQEKKSEAMWMIFKCWTKAARFDKVEVDFQKEREKSCQTKNEGYG